MIENINSLITYVSFVEAVFTTLSVSGLLWLRHKQPDLERPIKVLYCYFHTIVKVNLNSLLSSFDNTMPSSLTLQVYLALPIIFFVICVFLVVFPCYVSPWEVGVGLIIIISGIPVYGIFIHWKSKPQWLVMASRKYLFVVYSLSRIKQDQLLTQSNL